MTGRTRRNKATILTLDDKALVATTSPHAMVVTTLSTLTKILLGFNYGSWLG